MAFLVPLAAAGGTAAAGASAFEGIGAFATIAGAGISALGSIQSANAQSASAKYNSEVASNNAVIQQQNATWAAQAGEEQASMKEQETRAKVGGIVANQAAAGIDVSSPSAVDVKSSATELGELDAINIRGNAARTAYGYDVQSSNDVAQSQLDKFQASQDTTAGEVGAGSSILGGVGNTSLQLGKFLQA